VGEVAHRTIQAPFSFNYQDLRGFEQQRELARQSAPPVFLYDSEMTTELRSRVKTAFDAARNRMASATADSRRGEEEDTDQDEIDPWVPSDEQVNEFVENFLADLGVHIPREHVVTLIELGFPSQAEVSAIEWVSKAVAQRFILAERSALPADRRPLLFIPLVTDGTEFLFTDYESLVDPEEVRNNVTLAAVGSNGPWVAPSASIARALVQANVRFDQKRTENRAAADAAAVAPQVLTVK
jgi:membrane-associated HD superfamily phosphohydrolase